IFFLIFLLLYIIVLKDKVPKLLIIKLKTFQLNFFLKKFIKLHKKLVESSLLNRVCPPKTIGKLYNFILKFIYEKLKKDLKKNVEIIRVFPFKKFKNLIILLPKFLIG